MNPKRIHVKVFLEDPSAINSDAAFKIFSQWIAEIDEEVLVDVVDYSHLRSGPSTLLIGHQADYSLDRTDEKIGLLYCQKACHSEDLQIRLHEAVVCTLRACRRIEQHPLTMGKVRFRANEFIITLNDRLNAPNTTDTLSACTPVVRKLLTDLYAGQPAHVEHLTNPQSVFTMALSCPSAASDVTALLANLGTS